MEEGNEWENEMVEIEKITTKQLCSNSEKEKKCESSDSVYLDFSGTSSPNFELKHNTLIIQEFRKACEYMDRFGDNIKKLKINAENLEHIQIDILMRTVTHNCIELTSMILIFFNHGFSTDIEDSLPYIIDTRIHACNFDTDTIMLLINCSERIIINN